MHRTEEYRFSEMYIDDFFRWRKHVHFLFRYKKSITNPRLERVPVDNFILFYITGFMNTEEKSDSTKCALLSQLLNELLRVTKQM